MHALGARGAGRERVEAPLVEGAYGIPHRLRSAPKVFGDLRRSVSAGARKQDLAPAHHEGSVGAQPGFEPFALLFRQIPDKNWRFHGGNYRPLHTTLSEDALGIDTDEGLYDHFRHYYGEWFPTLREVHRTTFARQAANLWAVKKMLWKHLLGRIH